MFLAMLLAVPLSLKCEALAWALRGCSQVSLLILAAPLCIAGCESDGRPGQDSGGGGEDSLQGSTGPASELESGEDTITPSLESSSESSESDSGGSSSSSEDGSEVAGGDAADEEDDDSVDTPRFDLGSLPDMDITPVECPSLPIVLRDFKAAHPDFESFGGGVEPGMVKTELDVEQKPVASGMGSQLSSAENFAQWYRDHMGVNLRVDAELLLVDGDLEGECIYENPSYFPLDGLGFGNEGRVHNYHFTTEIHTEFVYRGGEVFDFRGDDDVWVFIDNQLALDLGGVHGATAATIVLDDLAAQIGLVKQKRYRLDMFHAERRTSHSNFFISTTLAVEPPPGR